MTDIYARDRVRRLIIDPMLNRWSKPRHVTSIDAVIGDYIEDLSNFDEATLRHAFTDVRRVHQYASWPPSSSFYQAAKTMAINHGQHAGPEGALNNTILSRDRTMKAHEFAAKFMAETEIGQQSLIEGWFVALRKYLISEAARQLAAGVDEPAVSLNAEQVENWQRPWLKANGRKADL